MPALRAAGIALAVGFLLVALAWLLQRHLVYFPDRGPVPDSAAVLPGAREVSATTTDGLTLAAWFVPPAEPTRHVAVLVANGNAGDRSARAPLARALSARGFAVLLFDYRGYGGNPGTPSERGLARDVRAARDVLLRQPGVEAERVVYVGESLGAAVITELATEHPPAGMVLRSPFVDLASVGRHHYPWLPVRALLRDRYPLARHLARVTVPVTVVYGERDTVVPPQQSRAVAAAAPRLRRLVEVPSADHNDRVLLDGPAIVGAVTDVAPPAPRVP